MIEDTNETALRLRERIIVKGVAVATAIIVVALYAAF